MNLLEQIEGPEDIKPLSGEEIRQLADEIRRAIISTVARNGGHLASSLGVVELTLAWHAVFHSPGDQIVWDVGHQSYAHKLITGRQERFCTLRQLDGLSGFPKRGESCHDHFDTGHSGTSISAALGLALARDHQDRLGNVTAVIGDGALTGGMAFEAINHAGHLGTDMLVILNDNEMSINGNVGAMSAYLDRIRTEKLYVRTKDRVGDWLERVPGIGKATKRGLERIKDSFKYLFITGILFEELGFTYLGPVDGHDYDSLVDHLQRAQKRPGPKLLHVLTEKGRGYRFAESNPDLFHGVGPFHVASGVLESRKEKSFTDAFAQLLLEEASGNPDVVAITAAMSMGTGLEEFGKAYPERLYDVGIAEQHAVTLAAGLAAGGQIPVVAIYATFMQRAADQVIHDVCLQNLPVVFCVDRSGLVGADGETHQGIFDLGLFRGVPNLEILMPADEHSFRQMFSEALRRGTPVMIRYPRETIQPELGPVLRRMGRMRILRDGRDVCLVGCGSMLRRCLAAADLLEEEGISVTVVDPWSVKPVDRENLCRLADAHRLLVTAEDHALTAGLGSAVLEAVDCRIPVSRIGLPDRYIEQGSQKELWDRYGLDASGISRTVLQAWRERFSQSTDPDAG